MQSSLREYRAFVPACAERNIGKTKAYELAGCGMLEVFKIGSKTYVYLDSLLTLPARLADKSGSPEVR